MRPPRLLLILFCLIFFPIFLTLFSALSSPTVATSHTLAGRTSGLHALFSFNIPSSLFPPSAIISLTDDNSTFFLARPAAFGPLLPGKGLSGQLWVGSGFGEGGLTAGVEGELGCSDIPGWDEGNGAKNPDSAARGSEHKPGKSGTGVMSDPPSSQNRARPPAQAEAARQNDRGDVAAPSSLNDGTDDHLQADGVSDAGTTQEYGDYVQVKKSTHADIQSLQETAEIQGNVVLLSRGGCGFLEKVKWAQRRGAIAVIVGDDTRGGNLVTMYARGDTSNVTIPALFTSYTTAHLLSSLIPAHSGGTTGLGEALKSLHAKIAGQANADTQNSATATTTKATAVPSSTSTTVSKDEAAVVSHSNSGFFRTIGAFFGLCSKTGGSGHQEDSRRPPSSGNIDWLTPGSWDKSEPLSGSSKSSTNSKSRSRGKVDDNTNYKKLELSPEDDITSDDFVIGVQDWRDPDLMLPKSSTLPTPSTSVNGKDSAKTSAPDADTASPSSLLRGGSITPGSGEYQSIDKSTGNVGDVGAKNTEKDFNTEDAGSGSSSKGWFSSHFGWGAELKQPAQPSLAATQSAATMNEKSQNPVSSSSVPTIMFSEHEGLWVTLTPTSMSTSPFFDTLLVLVISPLLTLTVVYALLLLRSRIRRRRWRAPKSVVERLPVRTYHTIAHTSSSSSSSSSPRPSSPGAVSPTSPLLGHESRPTHSRLTRSRSQTVAGVLTESSSLPREEKPASVQSGSILWRRKYTGRQVECVVCLEEYVDGQSRVMSLPCGHEFHAECITPWLTTRRRTCPICKGDVVRSMPPSHPGDNHNDNESSAEDADHRSDPTAAPVLIAGVDEDDISDDEQNVGLLSGHSSSAPQSSWQNLASLSFSALSGDTIWHQARADRNR
ncbi:Putative RING-9 protein [Penicillium brasilianum]|uniref:RING-type E3 ubiquitin transferase n=1 Tax=Penicillium brasilianum TaxID=104259 RepID=A0A0F7TKK5_PENBI|nr:Putative RING-9 protein [Penicillium brasilianum]